MLTFPYYNPYDNRLSEQQQYEEALRTAAIEEQIQRDAYRRRQAAIEKEERRRRQSAALAYRRMQEARAMELYREEQEQVEAQRRLNAMKRQMARSHLEQQRKERAAEMKRKEESERNLYLQALRQEATREAAERERMMAAAQQQRLQRARELNRQKETERQRFLNDLKKESAIREQEKEQRGTWAVVRGPDGDLYRVHLPHENTFYDDEHHDEESIHPSDQTLHSIATELAGNKPKPFPGSFSPKESRLPKYRFEAPRKRGSIVEDASDTEDDGNPMKSVWNNRRPSPGLLMEPVEVN